jgi:hypothetical protein
MSSLCCRVTNQADIGDNTNSIFDENSPIWLSIRIWMCKFSLILEDCKSELTGKSDPKNQKLQVLAGGLNIR